MPPRFFVDENDVALGKALDAAHGDVLYPGHAELPEVPRGSDDDEWLPHVGSRGLVVITRDKKIRYRPAEKAAWLKHGVRGFVLTGRASQDTAKSKGILDRHWNTIEALMVSEQDGPWMYAVTDAGVREIALD